MGRERVEERREEREGRRGSGKGGRGGEEVGGESIRNIFSVMQ